MFRKLIVGFALLAGCTALVAVAQDEGAPRAENAGVEKEVATMARVIEDRLDSADLSAGPVRGEYIPTVGAIFTVRVPFPLVDRPVEEIGEEEAGAEEGDLWDHNARRTERRSRAPRFEHDLFFDFSAEIENEMRSALRGVHRDLQLAHRDVERAHRDMQLAHREIAREVEHGLREVQIHLSGIDDHIEFAVRDSLEEARRAVERAYREGEITAEERDRALEGIDRALDRAPFKAGARLHRGVPFKWKWDAPLAQSRIHVAPPAPAIPPIPPMPLEPYDAEKIESLKRVLIETVAQYGHRMESLPSAERILLVVEAPGGPVVRRIVERRVLDRGDEPETETEDDETHVERDVERRETRKRIVIRRRGDDEVIIRGAGPIHRDRLLLSIGKSDVAAETTYDALAGRTDVRAY